MRNTTCVDVHFVLLADRPDAAETVAQWYFDEWGHRVAGMTRERIAAKVRESSNTERIPLIVLAIEADEIVGAAELKYREMDIYPDKEHWLGGVFVAPHRRGRGIASRLANEVAEIANSFKVPVLYLQTEYRDGGLYSRLGWKPIERVRNKGLDLLVMERPLDAWYQV